MASRAHEAGVRDARPAGAHRKVVAVDALVGRDHGIDRRVALRMGRELQVVRERELGDLVELLRLDEPDAAVLRIVNRVDLADAPRLPHVGAAGQHPAIQERLDAPQPQHVVVLVQRVRRGLANRGFDPVERRLGVHAVGHERAARQRVLREQRPVQLEAALIGIGVDDAGDADGVVVGQHFAQPGEAVGGGRRGPARPGPDVAPAVAQDPRRLAARVALDAAGLAVGHSELRVDAAHRQGQ